MRRSGGDGARMQRVRRARLVQGDGGQRYPTRERKSSPEFVLCARPGPTSLVREIVAIMQLAAFVELIPRARAWLLESNNLGQPDRLSIPRVSCARRTVEKNFSSLSSQPLTLSKTSYGVRQGFAQGYVPSF